MTRTSKEWERIFGRGKFPGAPHRWLQEWINDDHAETAGLMLEVEDPEFGTMTQPGPVVWLEESSESMLEPAPRRHVTFDQALHALAAIETKLPRVREKNARDGWLDGVRVLDLCNVIAGPHSASYLARFGAEVIKLDPSKPSYDCWNTVIFGISHMRGKRSILTDISSADGRVIFEKLVKSVDVIVWNAPDRQVKAMGLDLENLEKPNPDAIFCKLDCFSGPRPGPRTGYLGYDDLSRFYYTSSDTFLLLSAYESDTVRFNRVEGLEGFSDIPVENRAAFLSHAFMGARQTALQVPCGAAIRSRFTKTIPAGMS